MEFAGELAERFALRGYDSVQLAAAQSILPQVPDLAFATFDVRLNRAAQVLGMRVPLLTS